jgi:nitrate reductase gamma subunit
MKAVYALLAVIVLILIAAGGVGWLGGQSFFGLVIPYAALAIFAIGFIYRVVRWAMAPVPFHIPTVAGQQKSLPWIKNNELESPSGKVGIILRLALEVLLFRSLFRNDRVEVKGKRQRLIYGSKKFLWLGGLAFHWSLLIILFRHLRLFTEPVPGIVLFVQKLDGFFQVALPVIFISDAVILLALTYLVLRRLASPQLRYISLPSDYLALFLIGGVVVSGVLMRLVFRVDVEGIKELAMSAVSLKPAIPEGLGLVFYIHLFLVSALLAYFPFSKLMHGPGLLFSPTRNLQNNSRMMRHVNPWSYPVKVHTYEEWEDEFRDKMKGVGLPVDKE